MASRYCFFEHTADVGIEATADSWPELLEAAAAALMALITPDAPTMGEAIHASMIIPQPDRTLCLFDMLSELLYRFETERFVASAITARQVGDDAVEIELDGGVFDPDRHAVGNEVKAITYHDLSVTANDEGWTARVIVDI